MNDFPSELILHICNFNTYKTNIIFKSICKHNYKNINAEQILYDNNSHKIENNELYCGYDCDKTFTNFILTKYEHIIYQRNVGNRDISYVLVTMNKYKNFILYYFQRDISKNKYRLFRTSKYTYIKYIENIDLNQSLSTISYTVVKDIKHKVLNL